jgi:hypothetical protein
MIHFVNRYIILFLVFGFTIQSCTKQTNETIPNNIAPPDSTVSEVLMETYINKVFISVLGRKPIQAEYNAGLSIIREGNLSVQSRNLFLSQVMAKPDYFPRLYNIARQDLLNDLDTAEITNYINLFTSFLTMPQNVNYLDQIQNEIDRLQGMKQVPNILLTNNAFSVAEMHKRLINNFFYDQLNMGTFNFVTATFEHFLYRSPTQEELDGGSKMVDGFDGVLFFKSGKTKNDFLDIFFNLSNDYYEGQVRTLFQRFLFRDATAEETANLSKKYKANGNYQELQKAILSMDEYAGLKK